MKEKTFSSIALVRVENIYANLHIITSEESVVRVETNTDLIFTTAQGVLSVTQKSVETPRLHSIFGAKISITNSTIAINGSVISQNGNMVIGADESMPVVNIYVPQLVQLAMKNIGGLVEVDDRNIAGTSIELASGKLKAGMLGKCAVSVSGTGQAYIAHAEGECHLAVCGSGNIFIEAITAINASIEISGSGDIFCSRGTVGELTARISGSGGINFSGVADTADLKISGSGKMKIKKCDNITRQSVSGSGKIKVNFAKSEY